MNRYNKDKDETLCYDPDHKVKLGKWASKGSKPNDELNPGWCGTCIPDAKPGEDGHCSDILRHTFENTKTPNLVHGIEEEEEAGIKGGMTR